MGAVSALFAAVDGAPAAVGSLGHLERRRGAPVLSVARGPARGGRRAPGGRRGSPLPAAAVRDRHPRRPGRLPDDARRLRRSGKRADGRVRRPAAAVVLAWRVAAHRSPAGAFRRRRGRRSGGGQPGAAPRAGAGEPQGAGRIAVAADRQSAVAGADAGGLRAAALDPHSRRGAAAAAAGCRAGPPLRRAAHRQSRPAGLPRAAAGRARPGRAAGSDRRVPRRAASRAILRTPARGAERGARRGGARPVGCRPRSRAGRAGGVARAAGRHRAASGPLQGGRAVARRDAPAVRPSGLADAGDGGGGRRRRRAGHPAHGDAARGAAARDDRPPRRRARPRRRAARRVRSGGAARRARAVRRTLRRPLRDPARAQSRRAVRFRGDVRRALGPQVHRPGARRPRLRRRLSPVHRPDCRGERGADGVRQSGGP